MMRKPIKQLKLSIPMRIITLYRDEDENIIRKTIYLIIQGERFDRKGRDILG